MHSTFKHLARALPVVAMVATIACSGGTPVAPDAANASAADTSGAGPDGSTLKATAPTLMSPTNNAELATVRPSLQIGASSAKFAHQDFDYEFEIQTSGGATVHKQVVGGMSSTPGDDLQTQSTYRWRARAVLGNSVGPWADFATFRTIAIPGCINGLLLDPAAYFFHVIGRKPGDRARDWFEVMANSGIPDGPPPGVDPGPQFYGMTQQAGSCRTSRPGLPSGRSIVTRWGTVSPPGTFSKTAPRAWSGPSSSSTEGATHRARAPSPTETTPSTVALSFRGRAAHRRAARPAFHLISEPPGYALASVPTGGARRIRRGALLIWLSYSSYSASFTPVGRWEAAPTTRRTIASSPSTSGESPSIRKPTTPSGTAAGVTTSA